MNEKKSKKELKNVLRGIVPQIEDLAGIYDIGLEMIDECADSEKLISLILDEYERRFNEMPGTPIVPISTNKRSGWETKKIKALIMFATQAVMIKNKSILINELKKKNKTLKKAIAEQKELEQKLVESERLKAILEVVGTLNHEINNPLTVILGRTQLLWRREDISDTKIKSGLKEIHNEADRIREVVKKLSMIIKPVSKKYIDGIRILDVENSVSPKKSKFTSKE